MKRILCLFLTLIVFFSLPLTAGATLKGDCSIEVTVTYGDTKITGGKLTAVRVGYVDFDTFSFRQMTNGKVIENIGKSSAVEKMLKYYDDNKSKYTFDTYTVDVKDGKALFKEIPMGLYLIKQDTAASGYNKLSAFLVTVPYGDETDVCLKAKPELKREPTKPSTSTTTTTGSKLPQTGQLTWPIPWLASSGMILFALGWWLCFGRKKDNYEK